VPRQRNGDGDDAAAGAEVQHLGGIAVFEAIERALDQQLGIRARDQHRRRNPEQASEEFTLTEQVGHRLAGQAARGQIGQHGARVGRQRVGVLRDQLHARQTRRVGDQHARFERGQAAEGQRSQGLGNGGKRIRRERGHGAGYAGHGPPK